MIMMMIVIITTLINIIVPPIQSVYTKTQKIKMNKDTSF